MSELEPGAPHSSAENPYQAPLDAQLLPLGQGPLSMQHRKILEAYQQYRQQAPTMGRLIGRTIRSWLYLIFLQVVMLGLFLLLLGEDFFYIPALIMLGLTLGVIASGLGLLRQFKEFWPLLHDLLNWDQVDAVLAENRAVRERGQQQ